MIGFARPEFGGHLFHHPGRCCPGVIQDAMLHQFTWQHFLIAALTLSLTWYVALFLLFYRGRLKERLSGKKLKEVAGPRVVPFMRAEALTDSGELPETGLMGKPKMPEGMSRVGMHQVLFAARNGPEVPEAMDRGRQLGLVPDVLEELKDIFGVLEAEQGTKQDFLQLFALVKARFPGIAGTPEEKALNGFIRQHVLFPVSDAELDALWR